MSQKFFNVVLFLALMFGVLEGDEMKDKQNLSMIELIANSQQHDTELVRVVGFLNLKFEGLALYLSFNDFEHSVTKNALWVELDNWKKYKKFNQHYVLIEGVFDAKSKGHLKLYSGTIKDVDRVILWGDKEK